MTPDEYEHLVASVLRREGWDTTVTPSVRDMGLDVVAERGGGVQAKMYPRSCTSRSAPSPRQLQQTMTLPGLVRERLIDRASGESGQRT